MVDHSAPFRSLGHALSWFNENNPARARSLNILEPERGHKPAFPDFSGRSPIDLYALIAGAVIKVLRPLPMERRRAFLLRNVGSRSEQCAVEDIAKEFHISERTLYRWLRDINADLEKELMIRFLIEPPEEFNSYQEPKTTTTEGL